MLLLLGAAAICQIARAQEPVLPDFNPTIESGTAATLNEGEESGEIVVSRYEEAPSAGVVQRLYPVKNWRFALDFGYSYYSVRTSALPVGMRSGLYYGADIHYFWGRFIGIGMKFEGNRYATSSFDVAVDTYYVAPVFSCRVFSRADRNAWIFSLSAGYVSYNELSRSTSASFSKGGYKFTSEIGYDIRMGSNAFFGLKIAATEGYIHVPHLGGSGMIGLHALELGVGFRF